MKQVILATSFVFIVTALFAFGSKQNGLQQEFSKKSKQDINSAAKIIDETEWSLFDLPNGATTTINNNTIDIDLPEPYLAVGVNETGNYAYSVSGGTASVTCECTSGSGGCSPAKVGKETGCVMTTCSTCKKSNSVSGGLSDLKEMIIVNPDEFSFFESVSELNGKLMLPSDFFELPMVINKLEEIENILNESQNPSVRKLVPVNIFGYVVLLDVPADIDNTSPYLNSFGANSGDSNCDCLSGSDCPYKSKLIAKYCDATNCKKCRLNGVISDPDGSNSYQLTVTNSRIEIEL